MWKFLQRMKEPSSQAGIASLAGLFVMFGIPVTATQAVVQVIGGITALAAIAMPEQSK